MFSDGKLHDVELSVGAGGRVVSVRENGGPPKIYQVTFPLKLSYRPKSGQSGDLPEYIR